MLNVNDLKHDANNGLRITRVTNACVLIQLGDHSILTDPWFRNSWGFNEDPGLAVADLPPLTAILGSHYAPNHWDIGSLREYEPRAGVKVYTSTSGMARRARKVGFDEVECLKWGETR